MARRFLGLWRLVPQSCKYDVGQAPLKATYSFAPLPEDPVPQDPTSVKVKINWTDIHHKDFEIQYQMYLTGKRRVEEHFGQKMQVLHEVTNQGILKSTTYTEDGEKVIMEAFRELKEDEKVLDVTMITSTPAGPTRIYQRYQKDHQ
jgi:hypothetical protein